MFALKGMPKQYQITVHIDNLNKSYTKGKIVDMIVWLLEKPEYIQEYMEMFKTDHLGFRCAQIVEHYGVEAIRTHLSSFYGIYVIDNIHRNA